MKSSFENQGNQVDTSDLSMVPTRDDMTRHTPHDATRKSSAPRQAMIAPPAAPSRPPMGWFFAVAVALVVVGAVAVLGAMHMQQEINRLEAQLGTSVSALEASKQNLSELSSKLSATGESVSKSGSEAQKQLASLKDEVNRINETANNANKTAIETAMRAIDEQKSRIAAHDESLKKVADQLASVESTLSSMKNNMTKAGESSGAQTTNYSELKHQLIEMDGQVSSLRVDVQKLASAPAANSGSVSNETLAQKISDLDEQVRSFDAFRRQTNASLNQLNTDIQLMNEQAPK